MMGFGLVRTITTITIIITTITIITAETKRYTGVGSLFFELL